MQCFFFFLKYDNLLVELVGGILSAILLIACFIGRRESGSDLIASPFLSLALDVELPGPNLVQSCPHLKLQLTIIDNFTNMILFSHHYLSVFE